MNPLDLLKAGYTDLISVTPPKCKIAPNSKIKPDQLGKVPGKSGVDGWYGYNWRKEPQPNATEVAYWAKHGANIGLRAGFFPAIDIDCTNQTLSNIIRGMAFTHLGVGPERVGRAPKRLIVYKTSEPFHLMRLWIKLGNEKHLVEVLGDGQQYVVAGTHPTTGKPYEWPAGLLDAEDLTEITRDEVDAWLNLVAETLDAFGYVCEREGSGALARDRQEIDQAALRGTAAKIHDALVHLPNTNELFPGRDDYLRVGYAIKAALGEDGYPLFESWALDWEGNETSDGNDVDTVHADWQRMQAPYEVGAPWLYEMAQKQGYDWAADEFDADESLDTQAGPAEDGCASDADFAAAFAAQTIPGEAERKAKFASAAARFSDADMADRFAKRRGESVRYCEAMERWLAWGGKRWNVSGDGAVRYQVGQLCLSVLDEIYTHVEKNPEDVAKAMCSSAKKNAVASYAQDLPQLQLAISELDAHPHLLNTPTGIINLRTGERIDADPKLFITKITSVAPEYGEPQRWMQFLREATNNDADMIEYLQRVAGYALTGDKSLHSLHFFYGPGGNGKGTFLNTLRAIWGEYAKTADMSLFVASRVEQHSTGLADLAGARLVIAQETDENRRWDEAKLKQLTSSDPVKARMMRKDFFEFMPMFKLLFSGNHRPAITNADKALRRRIHIVPFTNDPKTVDPLLPEKLEAEYAQILQWAIDGARKFYAEGTLCDPNSVHAATEEYFDEEDDFAQWLGECTMVSVAGTFTPTEAFARDYEEWANRNGAQKRTAKQLGRMLADKGYKRHRPNAKSARGFLGLVLIRQPGDEFDYDPALA